MKRTRRPITGCSWNGKPCCDTVRSRTSRWHIGDIVFDSIEDMNALLSRLAEEALYENWTFSNYTSRSATRS